MFCNLPVTVWSAWEGNRISQDFTYPLLRKVNYKSIHTSSAMAGSRWRKAATLEFQKTTKNSPNITPKPKQQQKETPQNVSQGFSEGKICHVKNWAWTQAWDLFGPFQAFPKADPVHGFPRTQGFRARVWVWLSLPRCHPRVPPWLHVLCNNPTVQTWLQFSSISYV